MKVSNILFFFFAIIAVKLVYPGYVAAGSNNNAGAPTGKKLTDIEKKKRNKNIMIYSSLASALALLVGTGVGLGFYYKNKNDKGEKEETDGAKPKNTDVVKEPAPTTTTA
ncbi:early transcribed membrane protein 14.1 [Plasmodium sp. DRC-Itaito]|nr:early transcribed membrane protein 14.1 [Plasmodium sp. DRC-Itaito]